MTTNRVLRVFIALTGFVALTASVLHTDVAHGRQGFEGAVQPALTSTAAGFGSAGAVGLQRISGEDRIATAAAAAKAAFPQGADVALVARADSFPDALTAAALAGVRSAPVLLTQGSRLGPGAATALKDLGVTEVVLVGGNAALSPSLEQSLQGDYTVSRVGGIDRYDTAAQVARVALDDIGDPLGTRTALLASGDNYPDALAAGSMAFHAGLPILLSGGRSLHGAARSAIGDLAIDNVVVVGGTSALSGAVVDDLKRDGVKVTRIGGATRLETARLLADHGMAQWGLGAHAPVLARADDFPDALVAGAYAGTLGAPILLAAGPRALGPPAAEWLAARCKDVGTIHALGGQAALSNDVLRVARDAAERCSAGPSGPEPGSSSLRDGIGGESRPSGSEYAIPEGYPHGGNTGVIGAGLDYGDLKVHEGNLTVTKDGAVIENLDIRGRLTIQADNVTVRRVRVVADTSLYALDWRGGSGWEGVSGLLVEDTEIYNQSNGGRAVAGAGDGTFRRINAYGGATVFYASSGARVEDSFIHDPLIIPGGHHDSVQSSGGTGPHVVRSTVLGRYRAQTSALILQSNFSAKSGVVLQDNFFAGGGYTVYVSAKTGMPHPSNVTVTGNLWQTGSWAHGPARTKVGDNWTWANNRTTDGSTVNP